MRIMLFVLSFIVMVTGSNISYTKESFSIYGEACMTDCINYSCRTGSRSQSVSCIPGDTPALTYYTTQQRSQHKFCLSRCGKFNEHYDWCYVSDNEWDYCNSELGKQIVINKAYGNSGSPCKSKCTRHGILQTWCVTHVGFLRLDTCEPDGYTYMQSKTIDGVECLGYCGKLGIASNWCLGADEKNNYCAAPARDFSLFTKMFRKCMLARNCPACRMERLQRWNSVLCEADKCDDILESGYVSHHAKLLENPDNNLLTQNVGEAGNAIYRYTVLPPAFKEDPTVPLLVRAKITKSTIKHLTSNGISTNYYGNFRKMGLIKNRSEGNNDEYGDMIGYILGGPDKPYNFVPKIQQLHQAKDSAWKNTEIFIHDFVDRTGGWAEMIIVAVYHDLPHKTRPDGFAVNVELYNPDNTLHDQCKDKYYSNDPEAFYF